MSPEGLLFFVLIGVLVVSAILAPRIQKALGIQEKRSGGE